MSDPLWTYDVALDATEGKSDNRERPDITGVSIDTRTLKPGELYVAIKGDVHDGHDFVDKAFDADASAALVATNADVEANGPLIRVPDPLNGMEKLGIAARARSSAKVIAVTGSVGKTGTKEALRLAFSASGSVHASQKSYNNHWGVPLTLANFPQDVDFGIFEIGMNHAGEITPLTQFVRPHIAIITTVGPVHLEFFDSVEGIAEAKAEIFTGLEPDGTAIINRDNPHFTLLDQRAREAGAARIIGFGTSDEAEARLLSLKENEQGSEATADICGTTVSFRINAPGSHMVMNALSVLAAVKAAGADLEAAAQSLSQYDAPAGRGARETLKTMDGSFELIDESYNANPTSMRAALAALSGGQKENSGRLVAVLGDMLELGETSPDLHAALAEPINEADVDLVFACGPNMRFLYNALPESRRGAYAETSEALVGDLVTAVRSDDRVMIKGSLGSKMAVLVEALRQR